MSVAIARQWPERLAAVLALAGVVLASLPGYHVRTFQDAGSDFKTLYASMKCFVTGVRAYDFKNIGAVFAANHVVTPADWYAHAPTYPPFTFALLAPIAALPMVPALYLWFALSAAALVWLLWSVADSSERNFGLTRPWRMLAIAPVAASPLTSFGLQIGNVSVVASVLCIVAVLSRRTLHPSRRAAALTLSLLLKPHLALCLLLGMFLSRDRQDRALVLRTLLFFGAALLCFAVWFSITRPLGLQIGDYARMVASEIATGCLNPRNHELLPPVAEITSLESLLGFFLNTPWLQTVNVILLAGTAGWLLFLTRSFRHCTEEVRLELLGAWSAFGLIMTYHRTHDGIILFLLLPWLLVRLRRRALDMVAWAVLALGGAMSIGSCPPDFAWVSRDLGLSWLSELLVYRQSAISMALLVLLLLADLTRQARTSRRSLSRAETRSPQPAPPDQIPSTV